MKKYIVFTALIITSTLAFSQTQLDIKINHKLGSNAFTLNDTCYNNLGNKINLSRLEYYLTVVSVTHDGGTITPIDKVLLINANVATLDSLTTMSITNLEKVTLAVGVKPSLNHNDPSLLPASHPLAPKSPSMHWGWTPGYRFVAMEGRTFAVTPDRQYEIHSLGDLNYFHTTISTAGISSTGKKTIELNADYLESIRDIDLSNGPLDHGEIRNNKKNLENFRDFVFTSVEGNPSVGLNNIAIDNIKMSVFPNPASKGENVKITLSETINDGTISITDLKGSIVFKTITSEKVTEVNHLKPGIYICTLSKNGASLSSRKFVVSN